MKPSRLLLILALGFALGDFLSPYLGSEYKIIGVVLFLILMLGVVIKERFVWNVVLGVAVVFMAIIYCQYLGQKSLIDTNFMEPLILKLTGIKLWIEQLNSRMISEPHAGLLNGILLGGGSGLPWNEQLAMKQTGLTHIIAVSGYNVAVIVGVLGVLKGIGWRLKFWLSLGVIVGFVILTGGSASVVRAGIMGSLPLIARMIGRKGNAWNGLIFAGLIMIFIKPEILRNIGFQLSFAATYGLIVFMPILEKKKMIQKIPGFLRETFSATLSAQVLTLPILWFYFGRVSLISPIANLLVVPTVPLGMLIGFLGIIGGAIWLALGQIINYANWFVLGYILNIARGLANLPFASVQLPEYSRWFILLYLIIVFYSLYKNQLKEKIDEKTTI